MNESENKIISLPTFFDDRGNLSMIEQLKQVPFEIRRVYWIYDVPGGVERGGHAQSLHATHRTRGWNGQLQQVACRMEQQGHRLCYRPDTHLVPFRANGACTIGKRWKWRKRKISVSGSRHSPHAMPPIANTCRPRPAT